MSNEKTGNAATASRALQPTETNPLDFVPDKIPFDTPYGPPISLDRAQAVIQAAVAEAKKRNWKMNAAVVDSGGNLVAFSTNGWRDACLHSDCRAQGTSSRDLPARNEAVRGRYPAYASATILLAFDGIIASRGGISLIEQGMIIGAIGSSGGTIPAAISIGSRFDD